MIPISINGEPELIEQLKKELLARSLCDELQMTLGSSSEQDRFALHLKDVASLTGILVSGLKLSEFAAAMIKSRVASKNPTLELRTPRGRVQMDLKGKSEDEISALVKAAFPFLD